MQAKYTFKPYSNNFPLLFSLEKTRIAKSIGDHIDIEHVGSTAIPGLGGKGIIDILISAHQPDLSEISTKIQNLNYTFRESRSTPERLFFRIDLPDLEETVRRYHLHLTFFESSERTKLITFRDRLKEDSALLEEYAGLKKEAAETANEDGEKYREIKDPFFRKILT